MIVDPTAPIVRISGISKPSLHSDQRSLTRLIDLLKLKLDGIVTSTLYRGICFAICAITITLTGLQRLASVHADDAATSAHQIVEDDDRIRLTTTQLSAAVKKRGYVSGIESGSLVDKQSGFHDLGFGLDIVDWIMEPGSDAAYRDQLKGDLKYEINNQYHGKTAKRSIEGPQICTQAKQLTPKVIRGKDFTAIKQSYRYTIAAPGKEAGSMWEQTIVFPAGKRYFISSDKITAVNESPAMFLRIDLPGHIKHSQGDSFSEVFLSYHGLIQPEAFLKDFAPDEKFLYTRGVTKQPERFIRAYHIRDPKTAQQGPWLAGMTLQPDVVSEAWCHQRGYICMIEEFGGRPVKKGESFSAAFIVGFFDSIEEMQQVYDAHRGHTGLEITEQGWKLVK